MDEDTLRKRVDQHGLQVDSIERTRMHRAVRAGVLDEPLEPTLIGRYAVLRRLGAGGMGVVYVARDAELHREVALKVVLGPTSGGAHEQQRLLDEARALARIAHPNVVAIFDVGVHERRVFIAMELVHGETLRVHCSERCASWRERVAAYLQAGRGLAATHAAGLVHRDFKPDNALVGHDGRVQVLDFGLAHGESIAIDAAGTATDTHERAAERRPTSSVVGTFRYMAPEQLRRGRADARADQFSFCVALWETLYREHPFAAVDSLAKRQRPGVRAFPEISSDGYRLRGDGEREDLDPSVPAWVRHVLQRGLAIDPQQRFASMNELLAALADDPVKRRRRRLAAVLGLAAIPGAWGIHAAAAARDRQACVDEGATISEVWNDDTRATVRGAILGPQLSYGVDTWERVEPRVDGYAASWATLRTSTCLTALAGRRQADLAARSSECLLERRDELAATLDELAHAQASTVGNAVISVAELPSLSPCDDVAKLAERSPAPDDPALREEVAALRRELAASRASWTAGRAEAALVAAEAVLARTETLDWPALRLAALTRVGEYLDRDDATAAVARYEEAFALAVREGDDDVAMNVLARLTTDNAADLGRPEQARLWLQVAEAFVARADPGQGLPTADLLNARAVLSRRQGDFTSALADQQHALEIRERSLGPDDGRTLQVLGNIGAVQMELGEFASAAETMQRVLEGRTRLLGPEHPEVAKAMTSLAAVYGTQGRYTEAREILERALAIEERALGPDHAMLVTTLHNLGLVHDRLGDDAAGLAALERALTILEHAPATDPLRVGHTLLVVAGARGSVGDVPGALAAAERATTIIETALGRKHPEFALALDELAFAHFLAEDYQAARAERREVVEIREATLGPWHGDTGSAWRESGVSELALGDVDTALASLHHGLSITFGVDGPLHPNVYFAIMQIGLAYRVRGDLDLALSSIRTANAVAPFAFEGRVEYVAEALRDLGEVLLDRGELAAALTELQRAWVLFETLPESRHLLADRFLMCIADAELRLGRHADAARHARAAVEHARARRGHRFMLAEAEIVLADVLRANGEPKEARALAQGACGVEHPAIAFRFRRCDALLTATARR